MKKLIAVITIASILVLSFSTFVFASEKTNTPQWFNDMMTWKKAQISQGVKDGTITQDQADAWYSHIESMSKWHSENGFGSGMMSRFKGNFGPRANGGINCGSNSGMMQGFTSQN